MATAFNNIFSIARIEAILTDKNRYASHFHSHNGVRCHDYSLAYFWFQKATDKFDSPEPRTPKELQAVIHHFFFEDISGDNVDSYRKDAEKIIWQYFLRTGKICSCVIRDVNNELSFTLWYGQEDVARYEGKKETLYHPQYIICQL